MTKRDKSNLSEALNRLCADIAVIAGLFSAEESPPMNKPEPVPEAPPTEPQVEEPQPPAIPEPEPAKPVTYEQVRAALAEKSRTGFRAEVKALLTAHGVKQLSEITDPAVFADLLREAEEIGDG